MKATKENCTYTVVEVISKSSIRVSKTTVHSRMMNAVTSAIKSKHPYRVIREPVSCTTV